MGVLAKPRVESARLHNLPDCYKIKLKASGYRLVYQVQDSVITVFVIAVGKREKSAAYHDANKRLKRSSQMMHNLVAAASPDECRVF